MPRAPRPPLVLCQGVQREVEEEQGTTAPEKFASPFQQMGAVPHGHPWDGPARLRLNLQPLERAELHIKAGWQQLHGIVKP